MKAVRDKTSNVAIMMISVLVTEGNIVGKGENAVNQKISPFPIMFYRQFLLQGHENMQSC